MPPTIGRGLSVPTFLAVSALAAATGCPGGDKTTTGTETDASTTDATTGSTSTTGTTTTGSTTTGPTTTGPTTTDATGTTGGLPDCKSIADQATCEATMGCVWPPEVLQCIVECAPITDQATCMMQDYCLWSEGKCEFVII